MRVYEIIFILRPEVSDEELKTTVRQVSDAIEEGQGVVDKVESWGKRRLAYSVKRHKEGYYLLIQYSVKSNAGLSKEIERRLKVMDDVIKYMTVRIDEDLKRLEKLRKKRELRVTEKNDQWKQVSQDGRATKPEQPEKPAE